MKNIISKVYKNSIADELGVEIGDRILSINGNEIKDVIDYRFLMAEEYVVIELEKKNSKEIWELEIEKNYDEKLGVDFEAAILDEAKSCRNNCIFCFIDQLPKGMRKSLYFKDDDSRLSFLQGNFVTLTNLSDEDIDRIIKYKISPINISVHTTNPELRIKMLNNRFAGNIMERLKMLSEGGIKMNCQIVLCPEVNNGEQLLKTVADLFTFYPNIQNLAAVPVGITKYREGLYNMKTYDAQTAKAEILAIKAVQEEFIEKIGVPFVRLSDEFYVLANAHIPPKSFYGDFDQLVDGIGMIRTFRDNIDETIGNLKNGIKGSFTMITGISAYNEINKAAEKIYSYNSDIRINTIKIINNYFGDSITVAGLLTGSDIMSQLKNSETFDNVIIPKNMLKADSHIFLDDITIEEIEKALNKKIIVCEYTGEDLIQLINDNSIKIL